MACRLLSTTLGPVPERARSRAPPEITDASLLRIGSCVSGASLPGNLVGFLARRRRIKMHRRVRSLFKYIALAWSLALLFPASQVRADNIVAGYDLFETTSTGPGNCGTFQNF